MPEEIWNPSPNFRSGRNGRKIIAIVDHITAGDMPGCLSWLCNSASQASAHYIVTRLGKIYQLVREGDTAWHAGVVCQCSWSLYDGTNPNRYTLGIEHEGQPDVPLTEAQYQASLALHRELIQKYGIPIDSEHIVAHHRINAGHNCPGPAFPWTRLFADLKGSGTSTATVTSINIYVSGKLIGTGDLVNGVTMVPIAAVARALGHQVDWDATTNTIIIQPATVKPTMTSAIKLIINNQVSNDLTMIEGHAFMPVRDLVGALGYKVVGYDGKSVSVQ